MTYKLVTVFITTAVFTWISYSMGLKEGKSRAAGAFITSVTNSTKQRVRVTSELVKGGIVITIEDAK